MKKILFLIDSLGSGGAQTQIIQWSIQLKKRGNEVYLFTYHADDFYKDKIRKEGIEHIEISKKGRLGLNVVLSLRDFIKSNDVNFVVSFLDVPNFYNVIGNFRTGATSVISHRSFTNIEKLSLTKRCMLNYINSAADLIFSNSYSERENWIEYNQKLRSKFHVVYNSVNDFYFNLSKNYPKSDTLNILVVGSVSHYKNGLFVIEALKNVNIPFTLKWVGRKNYMADTGYFSIMCEHIKRYSLSDKWQWKEPTNEIHLEYQNADVLLLASEIEGLPNVVCEAMAVGLPILISNVLDHPHLVEDAKNGYLFDVSNPLSLAESIEKMYNSDLEKLGTCSKEKARDLFDIVKISDKMEAIFN